MRLWSVFEGIALLGRLRGGGRVGCPIGIVMTYAIAGSSQGVVARFGSSWRRMAINGEGAEFQYTNISHYICTGTNLEVSLTISI
jgi:hypothetical protein